MTDLKNKEEEIKLLKAKHVIINKAGDWESNAVGNRKDFADKIIQILEEKALEKYELKNIEFEENEGFSTVLAINATYGMGKTHFAKKLQKYIGENAIYFSVWKKDYLENPLLAFIQEIIKNKEEKTINKIKDSVLRIIKSASISAPYVSCSLKNLFPKNDPVEGLKEALKKLVEEKGHLVIIVDELDRCRPDYAVKVLETIKHFFDIYGLSFIIPINKEFLKLSIEGFYNFKPENNTTKEHYLDRFFDITEDLPNVKLGEYVNNKYNIDKLASDSRKMKVINDFSKKISLRQVDNLINIMPKSIDKLHLILLIKEYLPELHELFKEERNDLDEFYKEYKTNEEINLNFQSKDYINSDTDLSDNCDTYRELKSKMTMRLNLSEVVINELLGEITWFDQTVNIISQYEQKRKDDIKELRGILKE